MDGERSVTGGRTTRRGFLALAGASALAGCSALDGVAGGSEPTIRAFDLPDVDEESLDDPVVAPAVPVDIGGEYLDGASDRIDELLDELPTPLGADAIPNGHVRERLHDAADRATDGLDDARGADTELAALEALRRGRGDARYAAAGWAYADRGLSAESLREARRETVSAASSAQADHEYVGVDPVRAAVVRAEIERLLDRATDDHPARPGGQGDLLAVAEWGEAAEAAEAALADARHLDSQFGASLPADAGTVEATLRSAAETLFADVRSRRSDLPPEPTAEDWGLEERIRSEARREATLGTPRVGEAIGPASAVIDATERLAWLDALDTLRERLDSGEISQAESADDVRALRSGAYGAIETALTDAPAPDLARAILTDASWRVTAGDRRLSQYSGDLSPTRLDDVVEEYAVATAFADATVAACRQAVDAFETA